MTRGALSLLLVLVPVLALGGASGCAFRWGGAPSVPVLAGTRVVVDPSSNLANAAIEVFRADDRFVVATADDAPEPPSGGGCFAEHAQADLVVRIDQSGEVVSKSSGDSGMVKGVQIFPDTRHISSWHAETKITVAFSHAGQCKPFYVDRLLLRGNLEPKEDEAARDRSEQLEEAPSRVPAFLRAALGQQGLVVAAADDRGTVSFGTSEGIATGDVIELARPRGGHAGTAVVTEPADSQSAIEAIGGDPPLADMIATRRTSAASIEILPVASVLSTSGYVGAGARVEWHGVLRAPMAGVELSALGIGRSASAAMPSAYLGYLWEPRPRWLGLYVKGAAGALIGSADALLESASLGAKLRTPVVMLDVEAGYFVTEALATSDPFRWGHGPLVRLGIGFELR